MSWRLWWLYVPWVRRRRLARIDAALATMLKVIREASDEELAQAITTWAKRRTPAV